MGGRLDWQATQLLVSSLYVESMTRRRSTKLRCRTTYVTFVANKLPKTEYIEKKTPEKYSKSLHIENAVHKTLSHDNDDKTYKRLNG